MLLPLRRALLRSRLGAEPAG
ncbi:MAG: hypothetical protein QOH34_4292, partial [Mycobacterium sp.]|nr:hypothetical protein [Mycobacterium sp.]